MTIKDIAKQSGYGIGTVSRVINNQPGVSEKAREIILGIIKESNYEPNINAKNLKSSVASSIGIIVKGNQNLLFSDILERVQAELARYEEDVTVEYIDEDGDEIFHALRLIKDRNPKGIMFLGANLAMFDDRIDEIELPLIILTTGAEQLNNSKVSSVSVDDKEAIAEVVNFLNNMGHTKIGVIGGFPSETQISNTRYEGIKEALVRSGRWSDEGYVFEPCRYSMEAGYDATKRLLARNTNITAIVGLSDTIAIGIIRAIVDFGMRVPEDISVTGFDGTAIARFCVPSITTIRQDTETLAKRGVDIFLKHVHYDVEAEHEIVPHELIIGESVKKIN